MIPFGLFEPTEGGSKIGRVVEGPSARVPEVVEQVAVILPPAVARGKVVAEARD